MELRVPHVTSYARAPSSLLLLRSARYPQMPRFLHFLREFWPMPLPLMIHSALALFAQRTRIPNSARSIGFCVIWVCISSSSSSSSIFRQPVASFFSIFRCFSVLMKSAVLCLFSSFLEEFLDCSFSCRRRDRSSFFTKPSPRYHHPQQEVGVSEDELLLWSSDELYDAASQGLDRCFHCSGDIRTAYSIWRDMREGFTYLPHTVVVWYASTSHRISERVEAKAIMGAKATMEAKARAKVVPVGGAIALLPLTHPMRMPKGRSRRP